MESEHRSGAANARRGTPTHPRRADAERNIAAILAAATSCFAKNPNASMTEIAAAAGVGRVTLYGHFSSREALLSELMERALSEVATVLEATGLDEGPADETLRTFIRSSWQLLDRNLRMLHAARRALPAEAVHDHHVGILSAMDRLITRGRQEGAFRDDLPAHWLVSTVYALVQAAGDQVEAGRFTSEEALDALDATLASALRRP
ncbi:TetR/AcrR family transcriptional regulator [Kitasatospora sp. CM 4170]|uniref:TetR/AcrR family transcriptional regulator n=1 Tax=Kitasatospora aburaviensis TaxID=67265 RepID=A0ABW1F577_9ACTN|nr:TetR/AcrR family transcriptional regulator [Kitasatospora sp. CM 4170]WNM49216.1 TetR/AcrR family transcriptional regulator [Kitasatospora sp. CM 4170]